VSSPRVIDETPRIAGAKACLSFGPNDRASTRKTDSWEVWGLSDASHIGQVRWNSRRRKYCFFPSSGIAMDSDYLRSVAEFIECETEKRRKGKRAFCEASA
jgi:hypothetical protein